MKRRVLSTLLAITMLVAQLPLSVYGAERVEEKKLWSGNQWVNESGALLSGGIKVSKSISETDIPNEYKVDTTVESSGRMSAPSISVVFLFDRQGQSYLDQSIEVVKEILPELLGGNTKSRGAIVFNHRNMEVDTGFKSVSEMDELYTSFGSMTAGFGGYLDHAIRESRKMLLAQDTDEKLLVIITRNQSVYSTKVVEADVTVTCDGSGSDTSARWKITPTKCDLATVYGDGSSSNDIGSTTPISNIECTAGSHQHSRKAFPLEHSEVAVGEAQITKDSGVDVACISLSPATKYKAYLEGMQNKGLFTQKEEAVSGIKSLFPKTSLPAFENALLTEEFEEGILLKEGSLVANSGEISTDAGGYSWSLGGETGSVSYIIRVDVESPLFYKGKMMKICKTAEFAYETDEERESFSVVQPTASGDYSSVYLVGVLVNQEGEYLNERGEVVFNPEEGVKISDKIGFLNPRGVNQWAPSSNIIVNGDILVVENKYRLHENSQGDHSFDLASDPATPTVYFPFVDQGASFTVEHYISGQEIPFHQEVLAGILGESVVSVLDSGNLPEGYIRDSVEGLLVELQDDSHIIRVFYKADSNKKLEYTISYYKDNQWQKDVGLFALLAEPTVKFAPDENLYDGYELDYIRFYEVEADSSIFATITEERNHIQAYYKKLNSTPEVLAYAVDYYLDNNYHSGESFEVDKANATIEFLADKNKYPNYELDYLEFDGIRGENSIVIHITEDKNVVNVYYKLKTTEETLHYQVKYYLDGVVEHEAWGSVDTQTPEVHFVVEQELFSPHKYAYTKFAGELFTSPDLDVTITKTDNIIEVFYKIASKQKYIQEYYVDGNKAETVTEYLESGYLDFTFAPPALKGSHSLERVTFGGEGSHQKGHESTITGRVSDQEYVFRAYYKMVAPPQQYSCETEFYFDGKKHPAYKQGTTLPAGSPIPISILGTEDFQEKYGYAKGEPFTQPPIDSQIFEDTIVKVYYVSDENTKLPYIINYYQNGVKAYFEEKKVAGLTPNVTLTGLEEMFMGDGFQLSQVYFMEAVGSTGEITLWNNEFHVMYTREEVPELYYSYNVEHYYDNILGEVETFKTLKTGNTVSTVERKNLEGFEFSQIVPTLPHTITEDNEIIRVYYVAIDNEGSGEKPDPDPIIQTIEVEVVYATDEEQQNSQRGTLRVAVDVPVEPWSIFRAFVVESNTLELKSVIISASKTQKSDIITLGYSSVTLGQSGVDIAREEKSTETIRFYQGDKYTFYQGLQYTVSFEYATKTPVGENDNSGGNKSSATSRGGETRKTGFTGEKLDISASIPKVEVIKAPDGSAIHASLAAEEERRRLGLTLPKTGRPKLMSVKVPLVLLGLILFINLPELLRRKRL